MFIKELQPGVHFAQQINGEIIRFEVLAVRPAGRQFHVTFRSKQGKGSAYYQGNAYVTTV